MDTLPSQAPGPNAVELQRVATMVRASLDVSVGVVWCLDSSNPRVVHDGPLDASGLGEMRTTMPRLVHPLQSAVELKGTPLWVVATTPVEVDGRVVGGVAALHDADRPLSSGEQRLLQRCAQLLVEQPAADDGFGTLTDRVLQLERQTQELKTVNRKLRRFVYVASHDLQEPLRTVKGFLDLLAEDHAMQLDEEGQQYLDLARSGAHRLEALFQGVLRYARAKRFDDQRVDLSLDALLDDVLADRRLQIEARGAEIVRDPLPVISVAPAPMYQVLENLVSNALKYTPPGSRPVLTVTSEDVTAGGPEGTSQVRIVFADAGPGVPDDMHERIFEPFVRGPDRTVEGLGFGLAIARRIVERHGGRLISEPSDTGARFVLTLPAGTARHGSSPDDGGSAASAR